MCLLIPAEISALLTCFVWNALWEDLVIVCGNCCNCGCCCGCSGCSWARTDMAGVNNNARATALVSRVIMGSDVEFLQLIGRPWYFILLFAVLEANSYITV